MVGILIVSHSEEIAQGTAKLAQQMGGESVPLKAVGGTEDKRLGTEPDSIKQAINELPKKEGIIVLADMGSAIMNIELAFESFSPEEQKKFKLANAPIVEGAITAVLQAKAGKNVEEILKFMQQENFSQKRL